MFLPLNFIVQVVTDFNAARFHVELILAVGSVISVVGGFVIYIKNSFTKINVKLTSLTKADTLLFEKDEKREQELENMLIEIGKVKTGSSEDMKEFTNRCIKRHSDLTADFEKKVEHFMDTSANSFNRIYDLIETKEERREERFKSFDVKIDNITNFLMNNNPKRLTK